MKNVMLVIICLCLVFLSPNISKGCSLTAPVITVQDVTACELSITWVGDPNTSYYKVRYKLDGSSTWIQTISVGSASSYTFTGLTPGASYVVRVTPYCVNNSNGSYSNKTVAIPSCSQPKHVAYFVSNDKSVRLSWTPCGSFTSSRIRYRVNGTNTWTTVSTGTDTFAIIKNLLASTTYQYEVNTCSGNSAWTSSATFTTLASGEWRPNIIVFYLDDSRYDPFAPDGGPSFYESPGINRIADEGVNFKYSYSCLALCAPCRATMMTGLYPHHHGVYNNGKVTSFNHVTTAEILHNNGYYTGFVGKYGFQKFPDIDGFDYYLESSNDVYWNSDYDYNGQFNIVIPGHKTDVITNKAFEFLNSVPNGERFLLYVNHKAPHVPYTPRTQDIGIYHDAPLPFPSNFYKYKFNYPSSYYGCGSTTQDSSQLKSEVEGYYEMLAGAEASIDSIMTYLDQKGILDSTLVIFSSDQGLLKGEHQLGGKEVVLEESIHVPMFIRYPKWFAPGTVINDEISVNIDIAPTILEAAEIPDTFNMDGISMKELANHTQHRNLLFYEYFFRESCNPSETAVRDFNYKYISNDCASTTEEFYDLVNDPHENTNKINTSSYSALINEYRSKLDSMKIATGYIDLADTILPCKLNKPKYSKDEPPACGTIGDINCSIYPNPGGAKFTLDLTLGNTDNFTIYVRDIFSREIIRKELDGNQLHYTLNFNCTSLPAGVYLLEIKTRDSQKVIQYLKTE